MASTFTLAAGPNTDIWKKPPSTDVFTAPFRPHSSAPANTFASTSITFTTTYTQQYDQAGLLLTLTNPSSPSARKWIKAGVEFYNGDARLSVVACDAWADWSVSTPRGAEDIVAGTKPVTISVVRESDEHGSSLWVYAVDGTDKTPLREICWVLGEYADEGWQLEVSALVARPGKETEGKLEAKFSDFDVQWKK
ncbi:hypothetical protein B0J13DRAFT_529562 [Dactylonectria estremocensis]|uniref:Uncharacterized protein n=1 Tax=Dactylonectria estremocensis TaxID=1079267 RepID=A0A9P9IT94_9HYPO|nr:hypothetical protein B0J13DRAFT_529562 [Dactylonectria estremocensis]